MFKCIKFSFRYQQTLKGFIYCNLHNYTVTAPIFYVNSEPHIGQLYTAVICDVHRRWKELCGRKCLFSIGTDEHGLKIQRACEQRGVTPLHYSTSICNKYKELFKSANIGYNDFVRTTEKRHHDAVSKFWTTLRDKGYIYEGKYCGWYSVSDEAFLSENEVIDAVDPQGEACKVSAASGHQVEWLEEKNYMFRLSQFGESIEKWLNSKVIKPEKFEGEVMSWVREGLSDLSVSRERSRLSWGIQVPGDRSQTIYVWLDALVNYLTVAGYPNEITTHWPPDCHVIGKDILKFHAIYWPAFLLAAGYQLPKLILCHSHWLHDHKKMSKSLGNVVDPFMRLSMWGSDALRFYLIKEGVVHTDSNYNDVKLVECVNSHLVNTLANLLSRATSAALNPRNECPKFDERVFRDKFDCEDRETFFRYPTLLDSIQKDYDNFQFHRVIEAVFSQLHWANRVFEKHQPWKIIKSGDEKYVSTLLRVALETLRLSGIILSPIIPDLSDNLRIRLGNTSTEWCLNKVSLKADDLNLTRDLGSVPGILYQRLRNLEGDDLSLKNCVK